MFAVSGNINTAAERSRGVVDLLLTGRIQGGSQD